MVREDVGAKGFTRSALPAAGSTTLAIVFAAAAALNTALLHAGPGEI
jgi:hypothetical protein